MNNSRQAIVGLDIGGANLKAWHAAGQALAIPFALWKSPRQLSGQIAAMLQQLPVADRVAVTMTGELADCFATRTEGVEFIVCAVEQAVRSVLPDSIMQFWQTHGKFVTPGDAMASPLLTAASNWQALASMVGLLFPQDDLLLLDIGSTTTDLIPILQGQVSAGGRTDLERLAASELVYTGVRRTVVCHMLPSFQGELDRYGHVSIPLSSELFATSLDVYLLLGSIEEDPENCETADGRPATKEFAEARLARQICSDQSELTTHDMIKLAMAAASAQRQQIVQATRRVIDCASRPIKKIVLSGSGEFLGRQVAVQAGFQSDKILSLKDYWTTAGSEVACARALVELALEGF
ncbi:Hydantoinase/oxoprolinase [Planctopirus ephydatiae]|uniref:Hydantoinase/oxoprolinase n=1 Tax=Planctopirus ephydatiae TaxID=2528019 RepID=A0A518GKQ9_9PLAN|nr:hydantoinase/oxoprolinase family protein [Planctopirus ephydatiae]QDV29147.1 Hydantoinase/oxoprolinase [Planctopirus ephydatiae]